MKSFSCLFTLILSFAISTHVLAHMRMNEPPGLRSKEEGVNPRGDDDHFPLQADGSDFPCQNSHRDPGHNPIRNYTAGESVPVQIVPGALVAVGAPHGGGSCQFSLSYDNGVTFKVIHSIEGGCPLDAVMNKYTVPIPTNAPAAERALFAWTWFNRIGNREMYMNCAMVNIINSNTSAALDGPEIFKANIGAFGGFKTVESADVTLPEPGTSVDTSLGDRKLNQPILVNSQVQEPSPAPQVGVIAGPAALVATTGEPQPASPTAAQRTTTNLVTVTGSSTKTVIASVANTNQAAPAATETECDDSPAETPTAVAAPAVNSGVSPAAPGTAVAQPTVVAAPPSGSCTEGQLVCSPDGTQFSMCVGGTPTAPQPVAPGTACRDGAIGYAKLVRRRKWTW